MAAEPLALDLFCGAGGVSTGLAAAGFRVVGVDIVPQPRYPFAFVQADALQRPFRLADFDFVWASPPCQAWCAGTPDRDARPRLIEPVRRMLAESGCLTCIENVPRAPVRADLVLDGTMFPDLKVIRRRHFELSFRAPLRLGFPSKGLIRRGWSCVVGGGRCSGVPVEGNAWHTNAAKKRAMGIDWMTREELAQAIPPAYSEFIGRAALAEIHRRAA